MKIRKAIRYLFFVLIAYLGVHLFLYAFQEKFFFLESTLHEDYEFNFNTSFEEHYLALENGDSIHALYFKTAAPAKGNILYFHGNSLNLRRWGKVAPGFLDRGYNVFMIDYRGFGKSEGEPTETNLKADGQVAYDWLKKHHSALPVTIYGRSIGSGVASYVAANNPAKALILETPFNNLQDVVQTRYPFLFLSYPLRVVFPNDAFLQNVDYPIYVFHGDQDRIIPLECAEKLKASLKKGDQFYTINGGTHRNLNDFEEVATKLDQILK